MMVTAIDQRHAHGGARKLSRSVQATETTAHDHNVVRRFCRPILRDLRDHLLTQPFQKPVFRVASVHELR